MPSSSSDKCFIVDLLTNYSKCHRNISRAWYWVAAAMGGGSSTSWKSSSSSTAAYLFRLRSCVVRSTVCSTSWRFKLKLQNNISFIWFLIIFSSTCLRRSEARILHLEFWPKNFMQRPPNASTELNFHFTFLRSSRHIRFTRMASSWSSRASRRCALPEISMMSVKQS